MRAGELIKLLHGVRSVRGGWIGCCPAHDDRTPSLSVNEGDDRVLLFCHAGCTLEQVCAALRIKESDLFYGESQRPTAKSTPAARIVAEYPYTDENGRSLYQVVRYEPKGFRQRRPDGKGGWIWSLNGTRRVLYRLPEVLAAKDVLAVEGEKDVETARKMGLVATCNPGGAGKWLEEYAEYLKDKRITIITDMDEPGRKHAQQVAASLFGKAQSVKVLEFANAKDLTQWVERGGTRDALLELTCKPTEWKATAETPNQQAGVVLRCFSDIVPKPLRWLWPERIPLGKLTLLIGDPGLGKSLLTADVASRVTRGACFPDGATSESGSVIFLSAEDDPADTIRPRLDAAGADVSRVHTLEAVRVQLTDGSLTEKPFNLETDVAALEGALTKRPDVRLIVIDPISAYLGGVDSHSNAEVRGLLSPLAALAAKHGVAVLGVTHLRKSAGAAVHRAIASIAFTAAARAVWAVAPDPSDTDRRLMLAVKQNLAPNIGGMAFRVETENGLPCLAWELGAVTLDANDVLNVDSREGQSERKEAEEWLRDYLADGPVSAREAIAAARHVGITKTTLWRAANSLAIVKRKLGGRGAGWEWSLQDSKNPAPVCVEVDSLDSSTKQLKTKPDGGGEDSKNPHVERIDPLESLPLTDYASDGEADGDSFPVSGDGEVRV